MGRSVEHNPSTLGAMILIVWGLFVWLLHFSTVYIAHTLLCAQETRPTTITILALWATAFAVVVIAPVVVAPQRMAILTRLPRSNADGHHVVFIARIVAVLSLVAVLWTGATTVLVDGCELLR